MTIPNSINCPICKSNMGKISSTDDKAYSFRFNTMEIKTKEGKLAPKIQMFLCPDCNNIQQHLMM